MPEGEGAPRELELMVPESIRAGVWANFAQVSSSPYEFNLDFARLEFGPEGPTGGIVVARVAMSPLFIRQLIDALNSNWDKYVARAMPPEVMGHEQEREAGPGGQRSSDDGPNDDHG